MIISTHAIVLKTIKYGDSSLICRLFTKDHGKIVIMAKGAWRPKKSTGALLEPISHIHIQYYHKNNRDIQILKDADCLLLLTEWQEFRSPDFNKIKSLMKNPIIFDGRNIYDKFELEALNFELHQI